MNPALRPFVTAGVALVGAGVITVTPVATPLLEASVVHDVALTADIDFTGAWTDAINTAEANFASLQTAMQDANTALSEALSNADLSDLNLQELGAALTFLDGDQKTFINPLTEWTLNGAGPDGDATVDATHALLYGILTNQGGAVAPGLFPEIPAPVPDIINFLSSPLAGVLIGALGPSIAPWVALLNSVEAISANLGGDTPDTTAALQELVNIPANMFNGLLNGATLNLDALIPAIADADLLPLPEGTAITSLSFAFGGLLTPGLVGADPGDLTFFGDAVPGGGSIFNSLGLGLSITDPLPLELPVLAHGVGLGGAMAGLEQAIAEFLSGNLVFDPPDDVVPDPGLATDGLAGLLADLFGGGL
ncbi:hypothetical protein MTER_08150 [Mycolicibacter terrae]|uniref:PE-PGRS family protein n=1 Tax=Mycolicibacter terrae TaxID=1788 RepID=A0AAD1MGW8_9MYCO|nr:outer membrane porin GjpA [Mycolicibacter terrae]ORW91374.1 hypothetical protein AWC28_18350 [Mycolicibacter terrae]BBX21404.1 hypothetical protein MTER_08150 [Mycolicibacter terrae]SNV89200.1 Uncharacterised protein [Mycolicibacter terrae]